MQEVQVFSGAQQHDFHAQASQGLQIFVSQYLHCGNSPIRHGPVGKNHNAARVAHCIHHDVSLAVTGESILGVAAGKVEFQNSAFFAALRPIR